MSNNQDEIKPTPTASVAAAGNPAINSNLAERLDLLEVRLKTPASLLPAVLQSTGTGSVPNYATTDDVSLLTALASPIISQQSFQFDPSTLSKSDDPLQMNSSSPLMNNPSPSLVAVSRAADIHIQKIAAMEQLQNSQQGFSNSSYLTVKRSHTVDTNNVHSAEADKVVKETPELSEPPKKESETTQKSPRALVMTNNQVNNTNNQEQKQTAAKKAPNLTKSPQDTHHSNHRTKASNANKRKSTPVKLQVANNKQSKRQSVSSKKTDTAENTGDNASRKRTKLQLSAKSKANKVGGDPAQQGKENAPAIAATNNTTTIINTNSRSNHTPVRTTTASSKHKPPKNNRLIRDFFSAVPVQPDSTEKKTQAPSTEPGPTTPTRQTSSSTTNPAITTATTPSPRQQVAQLEAQCRQMEALCQEKEAQLKAVSNNRSIQQMSLQSAFQRREEELQQVQKSFSTYRAQVGSVLEDLMRNKALHQAQQTRERLAADATRLGRLVYTRAGITRSSVESWEEGTASRRLQERRDSLLAQKAQLEQRQAQAQAAAKSFVDNEQHQLSSSKEAKTGVDGMVVVESRLEALEAVESVRYHLETNQKQLQELQEEEKRLKQEKVEHVRALRRLNAEDASRFRHRPKLNERYVAMALLGKGGFSEVWRAYDVEQLQEVAVKIHQLDPRWSEEKKENYTKHVSREYEIHRNVRHPRIVSLLDVFEVDSNSFCTVLELCDGTDLDTVLKQKTRLPERDARAILLQVLSGMKYLSSPSPDGRRQAIIHFDLKPGNILFNGSGDAFITDFGLSKIVENHDDPGDSMELTSQGAGTYWYLPPECFVMDENVTVRISNKVDVWSIGVIYFQMLFGRRPFGHGKTQDRLLSDGTMLHETKDVVFPQEPQVSEAGKEFIRSCLQYDQHLRPTVAELCESPYVTTPGIPS